MGHYSDRYLRQLEYGEGEILNGDTALINIKSLLEAGVQIFGSYPGSPMASTTDVAIDAKVRLQKRGVYVDESNEAGVTASMWPCTTSDIRGMCVYKIVGVNVASDVLAHISSAGVKGGLVIIVGEDPACDSTIVAQKLLPYAIMFGNPVLTPNCDTEHLRDTNLHAFLLSEATRNKEDFGGAPVFVVQTTATANMRGKIHCHNNLSFQRQPSEFKVVPEQTPMIPYCRVQEKEKTDRLLKAREYIKANKLNRITEGKEKLGFITYGQVYNSLIRALNLIGEAGLDGSSNFSILNLCAIHPLVPEEIIGFCSNFEHVSVVEENFPTILEKEIKAMLYGSGINPEIVGRDYFPNYGELDPRKIIDVLELDKYRPGIKAVRKDSGFITKDRTIALVNSSRVYLSQEKTPAAGDIIDPKKLLKIIEGSAKEIFAINASAICERLGFDSKAQNIVMFALFPEYPQFGIDEDACIHAIKELEKNEEENLKVFNAVRRLIASGDYKDYSEDVKLDSLGKVPSKAREKIESDLESSRILVNFPVLEAPELKEIYKEATGRIWNFQRNMEYVKLYRVRVEECLLLMERYLKNNEEMVHRMISKIMRHLGTMMVYHDAPYVARLKLRKERLAWIRAETNVEDSEIFQISEAFHPDLMEIIGLLPAKLVDALSKMCFVSKFMKEGEVYLPMTVRTDTVLGCLKLRFLGIFEPFRLCSWRFRRENRYIEMYLRALENNLLMPIGYLEILADAPRIIRGYGETRNHSFFLFEKFLKDASLKTSYDLERDLKVILKTPH